MKTFKEYTLLKEINENTILYHRSTEDLYSGQILEPHKKFKEGHWLESIFTEKKLEEYRKEHTPEKPSRFNCIYSSITPRSVFIGKGNLYEIKPMGNFHVTMAYYINDINNTFSNISYSALEDYIDYKNRDSFSTDEEYKEYLKHYEEKADEFKWYNNMRKLQMLFAWYWGIDLSKDEKERRFKADPKWIEVLCEKAVVINKIQENDNLFKMGDNVELLKDIKIYWPGYSSDGNTLPSPAEKQAIINKFNGTADNYNGYNLTIPKGTKGELRQVYLNQQKPKGYKSDVNKYKSKMIYNRLIFVPFNYDFAIYLHQQPEYVKNLIKKI